MAKSNHRRRRRSWVLGWLAAGSWPMLVFAESLSGGGAGMFSSEKVFHVGDLVTVVVSESSEGSQSASTALNKDTALGLTTGGALNAALGSASAGINSKQSGGGSLARQGRMTAMITTRVEKILDNGCLSLKGSQDLEFDSGKQSIRVQGTARPRDISSTNEIISNRLADAQIEYVGDGALHEKARTGFLSRFLEWLWIF